MATRAPEVIRNPESAKKRSTPPTAAHMHTATVYPPENCANRQKVRLIQLRENIIPRQWPDRVCRRAQGNVVRIGPWSESHSFSAHRVVPDWRITLSNALAYRAYPEVRIAKISRKTSPSAATMFVDRLKFKIAAGHSDTQHSKQSQSWSRSCACHIIGSQSKHTR